VSIKNKLVTAVTTAGLLAGLFGSAFVPSVRAAATDATNVSAAIYSTGYSQGTGTSANPFGLAAATLATTGGALDLTFKTSAGAAIAAAQTVTYTASSGLLVAATSAACAAVGTPTLAATTVATSAAGLGCLTIKSNSVGYKAQVGTVTITHGVTGTIGTLYIWAIGDVTSVTLALATGRSGNVVLGNAAVADYATINSKDATGNRITVVAAGTGYTLTTGTADLAAGSAANKLGLTASSCLSTAALKSTVAMQVTHTATSVASNSVTLTCTGEGVRVTGVKLEDSDGATVTSGAKKALTLKARFVDEDGVEVGDGGAVIDILGSAGVSIFGAALAAADFAYSPIEVADSGAARTGAAAMSSLTAADAAASMGYVTVGTYTPSANFFGKNSLQVMVEVVDQDATTAATATFTISYTTVDFAAAAAVSSTIGIVAGPKLKTATITLSAAAGKLVTVTIEKVSTGKTYSYYRKANASGVATFTIRRVGTWEVFASYGDDVTETVTLKK